MPDFETTEASNPQIYTNVDPEGLYIITGNDVISYFRLAANCIHVTATAANFTVTKKNDLFGKSQKLLELTASKLHKRVYFLVMFGLHEMSRLWSPQRMKLSGNNN